MAMIFRYGNKSIAQIQKLTSGTIQSKSFCIAKETISKNEKTAYGMGGSISTMYLMRDYTKKSIKNSYNSIVKKHPNNPLKNKQNTWNGHFFHRRHKGQQVRRRCSKSLIIREIQIKTKMRCHLTSV